MKFAHFYLLNQVIHIVVVHSQACSNISHHHLFILISIYNILLINHINLPIKIHHLDLIFNLTCLHNIDNLLIHLFHRLSFLIFILLVVKILDHIINILNVWLLIFIFLLL
jgi:hypothetical protein